VGPDFADGGSTADDFSDDESDTEETWMEGEAGEVLVKKVVTDKLIVGSSLEWCSLKYLQYTQQNASDEKPGDFAHQVEAVVAKGKGMVVVTERLINDESEIDWSKLFTKKNSTAKERVLKELTNIEAMHDREIVHWDVKEPNIINGKLIDMGTTTTPILFRVHTDFTKEKPKEVFSSAIAQAVREALKRKDGIELERKVEEDKPDEVRKVIWTR
jgi:hypothetical protein